MYDGFISYSHAADDLLAPRLQAGLQRFAKPWWKRRALRIFRDESSLSANPHLWSSIVEALDKSEWFVLLLSPEAAQSEWVNQEIEHWTIHKDPFRILPVVTDGEFGWTSHGEVTGSSVPDTLQRVFEEEPRWVDLRFAKGEKQLDLQNPQFSDAVADVASAIRGVPKDELASEEVRQHRRTVRTAWAAGAALLALAVAAVGFGIQSVNNANEAEAQAERAAQNEATARAETERADEAADEALASAAEADASAAEALRQADIARSRELAAASVSHLEEDPELAMMLALESLDAVPGDEESPAAVIALRQTMLDNNLLRRFPVDKGPNYSVLSPDGLTVYNSSQASRTLTSIDLETGDELWIHHDPTTNDAFHQVSLSPDGSLISLAVNDFATVEDDTVEVDENGNDAFPARILILDTSDGSIVEQIVPDSGCEAVTLGLHHGFSPDGRYFTFYAGTEECSGVNPADDWMQVYDTDTWGNVATIQIEGMLEEEATFSADSSRILISGDGALAELRTFPDLELIHQYTDTGEHFHTRTALSPDGKRAVVWAGGLELDLRPLLVEAETGDRIAYLDAVDDFPSHEALTFSPEGDKIGVTTRSGGAVFDGHTGRLLSSLRGRNASFSHSFSSNSSRILTTTEFDLLLWDLDSGALDLGTPLAPREAESFWVNPNSALNGPHTAVWTLVPDLDNIMPHISLVDPPSGAVTDEILGLGVQMPDGRFLINPVSRNEDGSDHVWEPLSIWDPTEGSLVELTGCSVPNEALDFDTPFRCPDGDRYFGSHFASTAMPYAVAPDGSFFAASSYTAFEERQVIRIWDGETLEVVNEFEADVFLLGAGEGWIVLEDEGDLAVFDVATGQEVTSIADLVPFGQVLEVSQDSTLVVVAAGFGTLRVVDTSAWEVVAEWEAHQGLLRGLALSDDASRLVTTGEDNAVNIWDLSEVDALEIGQPALLLDSIPAPVPSDAIWLDDETLGVFLRDARWFPVSLSVQDLVAEARSRLTRGFTATECATFHIEDCPTTLEAMQED